MLNIKNPGVLPLIGALAILLVAGIDSIAEAGPTGQAVDPTEVIWQIGHFDGTPDEFFPPDQRDTDFMCDSVSEDSPGTEGNYVIGTFDDLFPGEIRSVDADPDDPRFGHSCNSVTIEFTVPDGVNYSDSVLELARMGGEQDDVYFDGAFIGAAGPKDHDPFPSTVHIVIPGEIEPGAHTIQIVGHVRSPCIGGVMCTDGLSDGFHWVDALRLTGTPSLEIRKVWQIGQFDNLKEEFFPFPERDFDFVCDSVSPGGLGLEEDFIVGTTPHDRFPAEIRSADISDDDMRALQSCNSVTVRFMVPDGINYSDAMLKYSRPGSEKDSIYLDGDLLGSAGPQDTDPFDATTYSIPLGDIAPGMHTLRIVGEDSPDCVDGENCIGGKPDGYHWVDALKLTAGITCPAGIPGDAGAPSITGVDWQLHPSNSLIADFEVSVDSESSVWIEYQPVSGDTGILSTARSAMSDDDHEVEVMRMLADMQYCYQVFAEDGDGLVSDSFAGTFRTDPLPESLEPSKFRLVSGQPTTYPITMVDHETDNFEGAVVLDRSGNVVWYLDDFPAQDIVQDPVTLNLLANGDNITEMTPSGEFVRQSPGVCAIPLTDPNQGIVQGGVHHEVLAPQGDTVLYIGHVIKDPFNDPNRIQLGDSIRQWNRATNEDVQVWDPFEFLDPINDRTESSNLTTGTICTVVGPEDWTHGNSLQVVPDGNARPDEDGNIVMSVRDVNQIISIESDFSGLVWRLGDATHTGTPTSDFTFPDLSDQFYREHSARQLPNGNILLFDNGTFRPESEGGEYSRALELELDMTAMTATKVWEYRHTPDLFARIVSSVARLDNGNTVVMFGSMTGDACCRIATLVEADDQPSANAHTVIEISSPGMPNTYRAHPLQTINGEFEK